jgi:hypothetical protein
MLQKIALSLLLATAATQTAEAKPCDLDLQVVLLNASSVFEQHPVVSFLDGASLGLFSTAFNAPGESTVYELAQAKLRDQLSASGVGGAVQTLPARLSGRPYGWFYWDPRSDAQPSQTAWSSEVLGDYWMLTIHIDNPERAAVTVGEQSAAKVGLGRLLGADVRGQVYWAMVDRMVPDLVENGLQALVNTGFGVKCRDVEQRY